ncbi:MAG: twin-arginine translocase TatA/TatE family subunit [Acidimicrobiales bacterium]
MLNFSPEKLLLVGVLALVVLGPNRLPQAARTLARLLAELRRLSSSLQSEVQEVLAEPREVLSSAVGDLGIGDIRGGIRSTVRESILGPAAPAPVPPERTGTTTRPSSLSATGTPPVPDDPSLN